MGPLPLSVLSITPGGGATSITSLNAEVKHGVPNLPGTRCTRKYNWLCVYKASHGALGIGIHGIYLTLPMAAREGEKSTSVSDGTLFLY